MSTDVVLRRLTATYVKLKAATSHVDMSAAARYALLKATAVTGYFIKLLSRNDIASVTDAKILSLAKSVADLSAAADELVFHSEKSFNDSRSVSDDSTLSFGKSSNEIAVTTDDIGRSLSKILSDLAAAEDELRRSVGKSFEHQTNTTDQFDRAVQYARLVDESVGSADEAVRVVVKALVDTSAASEEVSLELVRSFFDIASPTDDFDGEATADDDQVMWFTSQRTELVSSTDLAVRLVSYARTLLEEAVQYDESVIELTKTFSETVSTEDALSLVSAYAEGADDGAAAADQLTMSLARLFSDAVSAVETTLKVFSRGLSEEALATDASVRASSKQVTETIPTSDEGSLVSQGYCDLNYFADDYVGARFTF